MGSHADLLTTLANTVAASPAWQAWTGSPSAADARQAISLISRPDQAEPIPVMALVGTVDGALRRTRDAVQSAAAWRLEIDAFLYLAAQPTLTDDDLAALDFCERAEIVLDDVIRILGDSPFPVVLAEYADGPVRPGPRARQRSDYWELLIALRIKTASLRDDQ